jgi:hypothetical protein
MSNTQLTPLQRTTLHILEEDLLAGDSLHKQYPLDYPRHNLHPTQDSASFLSNSNTSSWKTQTSNSS